MEYEAISIDEYEKEENSSALEREGKSLTNGASSSLSEEEEEEEANEGQASAIFSSQCQIECQVTAPTESQFQQEAAFQQSLTLIERHLAEIRQAANQEGDSSSSTCIFYCPRELREINGNACGPELVSIGPYYRQGSKFREFEKHKWLVLEKFLSRTRDSGRDLSHYLRGLKELEKQARDCYYDIEDGPSSQVFVEMMLLDGCFVLELLCHLNRSGEAITEYDPIFLKQSQSNLSQAPILIRDLLKHGNQIPFLVLDSLFKLSGRHEDPKVDTLPMLALKAFDLSFPRPLKLLDRFANWQGYHLLDLLYTSLLPSSEVNNHNDLDGYRPSKQSIPCVSELTTLGIRFSTKKAKSFLDIGFQNRMLKIPSITINDFTVTLLINCVSLENYNKKGPKYFRDYVSFMSCLISEPSDVAFLRSNGIITKTSQDNQDVFNLFNRFGKVIIFDGRDCYLSKQFRDMESYCNSNWATIRRTLQTYFKHPWPLISLVSATIVLAPTVVQTVMSVLTYKDQSK